MTLLHVRLAVPVAMQLDCRLGWVEVAGIEVLEALLDRLEALLPRVSTIVAGEQRKGKKRVLGDKTLTRAIVGRKERRSAILWRNRRLRKNVKQS